MAAATLAGIYCGKDVLRFESPHTTYSVCRQLATKVDSIEMLMVRRDAIAGCATH